MDKSIKETLDSFKEMASFNFNKDKYLAPVVLLVKEDNMFALTDAHSMPQNKREAFVRGAVKQVNPDFIVDITEAWMRIMKDKKFDGVRSSEAPDRIEVIIVNVETKNEQAMATREIKRDGDKVTLADEWTESIESKYSLNLRGAMTDRFGTGVDLKLDEQHYKN